MKRGREFEKVKKRKGTKGERASERASERPGRYIRKINSSVEKIK